MSRNAQTIIGAIVIVLIILLLVTVAGCLNIQIVECDATPESCITEAVSIDTVTDIQPKEHNNE